MDVTHQYETHPYPQPLSRFARPQNLQGYLLSWEFGHSLCHGIVTSHINKKILVAGCGTFEPLVVAEANPQAQIMAVDLSRRSIEILQKRGTRYKNINYAVGDLTDDNVACGPFDYIIATGVLHHSTDPGMLLEKLTARLTPGGLLRIMVYGPHSRFWVRQVQKFFRDHGLTAQTPHLLRRCRHMISTLPLSHPLRTTFENYSDTHTLTGLIDGFFHTCENPLLFLEWERIFSRLDLSFCGFSHPRHSWPEDICAQYGLSPLTGLAVVDALLELTVNPVLWLTKGLRTQNEAMAQNIVQTNPALLRTFALLKSTTFGHRLPTPFSPQHTSQALSLNMVRLLLAAAQPQNISDLEKKFSLPLIEEAQELGFLLPHKHKTMPVLTAQRSLNPHIAPESFHHSPLLQKRFQDFFETLPSFLSTALAELLPQLKLAQTLTQAPLSALLSQHTSERVSAHDLQTHLPWLSFYDFYERLVATGFTTSEIDLLTPFVPH